MTTITSLSRPRKARFHEFPTFCTMSLFDALGNEVCVYFDIADAEPVRCMVEYFTDNIGAKVDHEA